MEEVNLKNPLGIPNTVARIFLVYNRVLVFISDELSFFSFADLLSVSP